MNMNLLRLLATTFACFTLSSVAHAAGTGNLVANPSFETDWVNAKAQRGLISRWVEYGYNQSDLKADAWEYQLADGIRLNGTAGEATVARTGKHAIHMRQAGKRGTISLSQSHPFAKFMGTPGKSLFDTGQGGQGHGSTSVSNIVLSADKADRFFRDVKLSAWVKANRVPERAAIRVTYALGDLTRDLENFLAFPAGSYDWKKMDLTIPAARLADAFRKSIAAGQKQAALPGQWSVTMSYSPAAAKTDKARSEEQEGTVWFDDISVEESLPAVPNLAVNVSFENTGDKGLPAAWSDQRKFHFIPPQWYYVWRNWSHFFSPPRGKVALDDLIAHRGRRSFRFSVLPGDEKYCESDRIEVNQTEVRPIEIGVWVRADRIRYLDVRAVDEKGEYLNDWSFISPTQNIEEGTQYRGTFDWRYVRKFLVTDHPLQAIRVRLCARGFNGLNMDDVGRKHSNNNVGTLWWDDLRVMDVLSGASGTDEPEKPLQSPIEVTHVEFGERLYGRNELVVSVKNNTTSLKMVTAALKLRSPAKASFATAEGPVTIRVPARSAADIRVPYSFWDICRDWREQYHLSLSVHSEGNTIGSTELDFGTWPAIGRVEIERVYPYPDELKNQMVWINFGVSSHALDQVDTLRFDFVRRRTGKVTHSVTVPHFQQALAEFRKLQPKMDWQIDEFQLFMRQFDMSFLPVHDETRPVRDHVIRVTAVASGREFFKCESAPLGAMKPHQELLPPIQSVRVAGGKMEVNGKPFFMRAGLPHSWGLEPAPSQREPWVKQQSAAGEGRKTVHDYSRIKSYGFNTFWPNTQYAVDDLGNQIWKHNLYAGCWYPQNDTHIVSFGADFGPAWQSKTTADEFRAVGKHPATLMTSFTFWEGGMHDDLYLDPSRLSAHAKLVEEVKQLTGRPVFSSGGYSAAKQQYGYMYDVFGPETNWDGPPRVPYTVLHALRSQGRDVMGVDFPNIFDDMAYDVIRFELFEGLIRGHRGYAQIGKWPDNSLYRGFNGELRHLEKFIFAPEGEATIAVEKRDESARSGVRRPAEYGMRAHFTEFLPKISLLERKVGDTTYLIASNAQPIRQGDWIWTDKNAANGKRAHTGESIFVRIHPERFNDWHVHGYRDDRPIVFQKGDVVLQSVYIPTGERVENLMLMIEGNGEWNYNAVWGKFDFQQFSDSKIRFRLLQELHRWLWSSIGGAKISRALFGQELYEATFERDFLRRQDFFDMGTVPAAGKWVELSVPVEKLGLVGKVCTGFEFVSKGARVWWDATVVRRGEDHTIVLCDDELGTGAAGLAKVRFRGRGLKPGAKIEDVFEDRELTVNSDGNFFDDFRGENIYDIIGDGMAGDKAAPTMYYGGGYHYNYPNAIVRLYEIK